MILLLLKSWADTTFGWLEKFSKSRFWLLKSVLIISVITVLYAAQNYPYMAREKFMEQRQADSAISARGNSSDYGIDSTEAAKATLHEFVQRQINDPLIIVPNNWTGWRYRFNQARSRQYRLAIPVIGHYLHLNVNKLILLQELCGVLVLVLIILLVSRITNDRVLGILFALGFAFTYLGRACFVDIRPWFMGIAYLLLIVSMFSKKPIIIGLCILFASYIDERALMASGLIFIWWKMQASGGKNISLKDIFKPDRFTLAIITAWIIYFVIRYVLIHQYGFSPFRGGSQILITDIKNNYRYFMMDSMTGIKWFEVFIVLGLALMIRLKYYFLAFLFLLSPGILAFSAVADTDITKSMAFIFPAVFISLYLMVKNGEPIKNLRYLTLIIVILCFVMMTRDIPAA